MADTLTNVPVSHQQWVNLYTVTGLAVGTRLQIQNVGQTRILLHTGADTPTDADGFNVLSSDGDLPVFINQENSTGEWARSVDSDGSVNVGEAI